MEVLVLCDQSMKKKYYFCTKNHTDLENKAVDHPPNHTVLQMNAN